MLQKPNQVLRKAKSGDKASEEEYFDSLALMINTIAKSFKYADFLGVSEELINRSSKKAYKQILESSKKNIEESSRDFNKKFKEGFIEVIESYVSLKARTDAQKEMLINKYIEYNIEEIYNPMNATEELKKIAIKLKLFDYSSPYNIYTLLENKKVYTLLETIIEKRSKIDEKYLKDILKKFPSEIAEIAEKLIFVHLHEKRKKVEEASRLNRVSKIKLTTNTEQNKDNNKKINVNETLKELIEGGTFKSGDVFPTIAQIIIEFGIGSSYSEVQRAYRELFNEGYFVQVENQMVVAYKPKNEVSLKLKKQQ